MGFGAPPPHIHLIELVVLDCGTGIVRVVAVAIMLKGGGNKKGKQPAKKPAPKQPAEAPSEQNKEGEVVDQRAILAQTEALERAHSLPPGGSLVGGVEQEGWITRQASLKHFQSQIHL